MFRTDNEAVCAVERDGIMKTLKRIKPSETVKVLKLTGEGPIKRRIMDMGITKGI